MRKVRRSDIVDYVTYSEGRDQARERALELKVPRRIHIGPHLTLLFENTETIIYQIQEMTRAEQIVKEADIEHEIETYNELVGGPGELGATLLIEIESPEERARLLTEWLPLPEHLYATLPGGERVRPRFDERQLGETRLSSVQYLTFPLGEAAPVALGCDFERYRYETTLSEAQRAALGADLAAPEA
ncbi:MAG: DUF3501 family protein [Deltaproteobacteria bacterium]|nr:DUF3501 family protein [Deltaproteobacteria bacterium]MCB9786184.1 DUF3501 family protein [Deltaproteobacteria bacterium]